VLGRSLRSSSAVLYDTRASNAPAALGRLRAGSPTPATDVGPLIEPPHGVFPEPSRNSIRESWLLASVPVRRCRLWSPGIRLGVRPGSWFARTECFGPVLASCVTTSTTVAIQTAPLRADGRHPRRCDEVATWCRGRVGTCTSTGITGAIVQRQPFGGGSDGGRPDGGRAGRTTSTLAAWRDGGDRSASRPLRCGCVTGLSSTITGSAERNVSRTGRCQVGSRYGPRTPCDWSILELAWLAGARVVERRRAGRFARGTPRPLGVDRIRVLGGHHDHVAPRGARRRHRGDDSPVGAAESAAPVAPQRRSPRCIHGRVSRPGAGQSAMVADDPLLQPYELKHLTLRNRFLVVARARVLEGMPTDRHRSTTSRRPRRHRPP
jgi:hypothetical protein